MKNRVTRNMVPPSLNLEQLPETFWWNESLFVAAREQPINWRLQNGEHVHFKSEAAALLMLKSHKYDVI